MSMENLLRNAHKTALNYSLAFYFSILLLFFAGFISGYLFGVEKMQGLPCIEAYDSEVGYLKEYKRREGIDRGIYRDEVGHKGIRNIGNMVKEH